LVKLLAFDSIPTTIISRLALRKQRKIHHKLTRIY
jgi:hypothetical protein